MKKIEPAATPEQIRAREAEEENRRLPRRSTRRSPGAIARWSRRTRRRARSISLEAARSARSTRRSSRRGLHAAADKRREDLEKQKAKLAGKPMPAALEREFEGNESEMEKTTALIEQKRRERASVRRTLRRRQGTLARAEVDLGSKPPPRRTRRAIRPRRRRTVERAQARRRRSRRSRVTNRAAFGAALVASMAGVARAACDNASFPRIPD